ncbi:MAG: hypothetical protein GY743_23395 [Planctomycetaceae bacterium]|nr:hypothetical protein [Planctomycetaceae bacterium]
MFIDIRNLQERKRQRDRQFEVTRDIRNGYLFEVNGSVEGDRAGLVWFKAIDGNSEPFQVFYGGIIGDLRANMFVKIERKPKDPARWQISEFDTGIYFDDQSTYEQLPSTSFIPDKADYEWPPGYPGSKALNLFPRALTDFAVRPTSPASMKARVYSGIYPGATYYARFEGPVNTKDFTADIPGAGLARLAAISIDNTGTLNYTNGSTFVAGLPMPDAAMPDVPASEMLISAIRLVNGMTEIVEANFDLEMRPLMANGTVNIKVCEVWHSDFDAIALDSDEDGYVEINKSGGADARLEILDDSEPQLRLTYEDGVKIVDFTLDTNHDLTITPSSTGQIKLQPTTDSIDFFQVLDADGGTPVFNVDSTNERVGIGNAAPTTPLDVTGTVTITDNIVHAGDTDTLMAFTTDAISFDAGGINLLTLTEAAQDVVDIGDVAGSGDVDIDFNDSQMFLTGSSGVLTLDGNEVPVIVDSVTKTVQAAGGDFTTIQDAVDWFKNKLIVGSCIIDVEAATYAESVSATDLFIGATGSLEIQGDTRVLAGQSYVDGAETNVLAKANGGTGVFTLANAGATITVTGATTNPDFDADGWGNGDKILSYDNAGATAEYTILSVLNNVITLTVAAPVLGNDGTAIVLQPDRKISGATAITIDGPKGLEMTGLYVVGSTYGINATNGSSGVVRNCLSYSTVYGFYANTGYSALDCSGGANSAWGGSQGFRASGASAIECPYAVCVGSLSGFRAQTFSYMNTHYCVGVNCTTAFYAILFSHIESYMSYARQNTTGYFATSFSFIRALVTNAKNNGNGTNYNPAVSGTAGNNGSMIQWT